MNHERSKKLFQHAKEVIPGGVNSPVRACKSVGRDPVFIDHAEGCMVYDADGNSYIDYVGSWGPMILGHRHPVVVSAIKATLERGTSFGAPTDLEIELAEMVIAAVPSIDTVRFVNSGTEATMSAIRLARGVTGRDLIVKFDGCYHGHADTLLVEAGSGVATLGIPGSPGVPEAFAAQTISIPYNDTESMNRVMAEKGQDVACVIVEPVAGNMGLVPPEEGFLAALREATQKSGSILIFDEVITGFRVSRGGAQDLYDVMPDLTTLGKIIGGGMPVGAYGGRKAIMDQIAPDGPVYQAGTLSGNPLAMAAGIATLTELNKPGVYAELDQKTDHLVKGLKEAAAASGIPVQVDRVGSVLGMFFRDKPVKNMDDAKSCDLDRFTKYYNAMLEKGIYLAPSQFESGFVSTAHREEQIDNTIRTVKAVMEQLAGK
ncbi:MAG: glutamate-1-semialdehyde 2,1-aminomutase [Deltaproteobacteria bacterium]|nr:glutamate-1-semialdehyde 2,1-aminomutase [Deltaproteobacteria bacterium]MBW2633694.1 glutamate-1-semialdehyde 2,1-aminomutase [Deltaproteobacteria bacterium]MBW2677735.1 glutamate-1-semialdehyde 2,1-aminomutase [Deltaproteobacteria bacterium]